jgi:uncharacterized alpha-E superfamily protein
MLSRVAERVFWLARYLERVENTARLVNVHTSLLMDMPEHMEVNWFTPVTIFDAEALYFDLHGSVDEQSVMYFLLVETDYSSSLINTLIALRENARTTVDVLPEDLWEQVNELYLLVKGEISSVGNRHRRQALLIKVMEKCQCIWGMISNHMSRNYAYDFLQAGKHIERADMTSRFIDMTSLLVSDKRSEAMRKYDAVLWTHILKALSASQMYIQTQSSSVNVDSVIGFLVQDKRFPRSLYFSLKAIGTYLQRLPEHDDAIALQKQIAKEIQSYTTEAVPAVLLHTKMDDLQMQISALNEKIGQSWFYKAYAK